MHLPMEGPKQASSFEFDLQDIRATSLEVREVCRGLDP